MCLFGRVMCLGLICWVGVISAQEPPGLTLPGKSVSASKQFVVYSKSVDVRGAFCIFAERVKKEFLGTMGLQDRWGNPVVIRVFEDPLKAVPGKAAGVSIRQTDGGFHLQLNVYVGRDFTRDAVMEELVRLLLAEQVLRGRGEFRPAREQLLPDWLVRGLLGSVKYRQDKRLDDGFHAVSRAGAFLSADVLLGGVIEGEDPVTRGVYDASAFLLVQALRGQVGSAGSFERMLGDLMVFRGSDRMLLTKHFPGMQGDAKALEKWMSLELATLERPGLYEKWTAEQTEARLARLLVIPYPVEEPEKKSGILGNLFTREGKEDEDEVEEVVIPGAIAQIGIGDYAQIMKRSDREAIFLAAEKRLDGMHMRAYPLLGGMVASYQDVLRRLAKGKTRGVDAELEALAEARAATLQQLKEIEFYLDWWETTQSKGFTGEFDRYWRAVEAMSRVGKKKREDPVSKYLDKMQAEWE